MMATKEDTMNIPLSIAEQFKATGKFTYAHKTKDVQLTIGFIPDYPINGITIEQNGKLFRELHIESLDAIINKSLTDAISGANVL